MLQMGVDPQQLGTGSRISARMSSVVRFAHVADN